MKRPLQQAVQQAVPGVSHPRCKPKTVPSAKSRSSMSKKSMPWAEALEPTKSVNATSRNILNDSNDVNSCEEASPV